MSSPDQVAGTETPDPELPPAEGGGTRSPDKPGGPRSPEIQSPDKPGGPREPTTE